jgi:hypothetical protein
MTQKNDVLDYSSSADVQTESTSQSVGYAPDKQLSQLAARAQSKCSDVAVLSKASSLTDRQEDSSNPIACSMIERRPRTGRRKRASSSCSRMKKQIADMKQELDMLLEERSAVRKKQKRNLS